MTDKTGIAPLTNARIDIESLKRDLYRFKERLEGWADSIVIKTEAEKSEHVREMQQLSGAIEDLQREHSALQQQALGIRQRLQDEESEQQELSQELQDIRSRQAALPGIISQVQEALNAEANILFRKKAKVESKASVQEDVEKGLHRIIDTYAQRLGLILYPKDDGIEVGFTQIDQNDPDRVFSVHVTCGNNNEYSVRGKSLSIDLRQHIEDLNATGDFSSFVLNTRKAFMESCVRKC